MANLLLSSPFEKEFIYDDFKVIVRKSSLIYCVKSGEKNDDGTDIYNCTMVHSNFRNYIDDDPKMSFIIIKNIYFRFKAFPEEAHEMFEFARRGFRLDLKKPVTLSDSKQDTTKK